MTPEYILRKSLGREAHCSDASIEVRARCIEDLQFAPAYAEPGYTDPTKAILFADWNEFGKGVDVVLERYGFAIEWADDWSTCEDCGKAVRISPDSYSWQPSYVLLHGSMLCMQCADIADYLRTLENDPHRAVNNQAIDPAEYGYTLVQDGFESGLHPGQNDRPQDIFNRLKETHSRILFRITESAQFSTGFAVYTAQE